MPIGSNLHLPFNTTSTADKHEYPFITEGATEFDVNCYHGASSDFTFAIEFEIDNYHGGYADAWLTTIGPLGVRYDLSLCCPYDKPDIHNLIFELNGLACEYYHVIDCKGLEVALTTEPALNLGHAFDLCIPPLVGGGIELVDPGLTVLGTGDDELVNPITFDTHHWKYHYGVYDCIDVEVATRFSHGAGIEVALDVERNYEWDLKLCPEEQNPPLDYSELNPHNFDYHLDYDYLCADFVFDFYHGATCDAFVTIDIIFGQVDNYHGAYAVLPDLSTTSWLVSDNYSGARCDFDLELNPPDEFETDNYSGAYAVLPALSTTIATGLIDGYGGARCDFDLDISPSIEFDFDFHGGATHNFELSVSLALYPDNQYHGARCDFDLDIFPSIEFEFDFHGGALCDLNDFFVTPHFTFEFYHGALGAADLETLEGQGVLGEVVALHGAAAAIDYINGTTAFDFDFHHGAYAVLPDLSTTTIFGLVEAYGGARCDFDLELNLPIEFLFEFHHGGYAVVPNFSVTLALFPRGYHGGYATFDILTNPVDAFEFDFVHGAYAVLPELDEDTDIYRFYHGADVAEFYLSIAQSLYPNNQEHGAYAVLPELSTQIAFGLIDGYSGARCDFDLTLNPPDAFEVEFLHGGTFDFDLTTFVSASLSVHFVHDYAMFDGWGGVGGLNFCPTVHLNGIDNDTVIRFDFPEDGDFNLYEDTLNIDFIDYGFRPWNICNANHGNGYLEVDLAVRARFEFDCYSGHNTSANIGLFTSAFETNFLAHSIDIMSMDFNPEIWMRFCPGYIIPIGNSVVLDFASTDNTDCSGYFGAHGALAELDSISAQVNFETEPAYHGAYISNFNLTTDEPWELKTWHGAIFKFELSTEDTFVMNAMYHGATALGTFYVQPWLAYHGQHFGIGELTVAGPGIEWITPAGCVPNDYIPVTEDGDLDVEAMEADEHGVFQFHQIPVEGNLYFKSLVAQCRSGAEGG